MRNEWKIDNEKIGTLFMNPLFFVLNRTATIKHRCVTHLYGSNAIERFMLKAERRTPVTDPQFLIPNSIVFGFQPPPRLLASAVIIEPQRHQGTKKHKESRTLIAKS